MKPLTEIAAAADRNFVGRQEEVDILQNELDRLQRGDGPNNAILAIYGEKGTGKSRLIKALGDNALQHGALTADVDLNQAQKNSRESDKLLLDQVILQIGDGLSGRSQLSDFRAHLQDSDLGADPSAVFTNYINRIADVEARTMIVLLDNADSISQRDLELIQRQVIAPLLETNQGAAVIASRHLQRWPSFDLRRRLVERELPPFNFQETARQLGGETDPDISALAQAVQGLTGGLPGANKFVVETLADQPNAAAPAILETLVDNYLFQQPPNLKEEITAVSPLPSFGYALLKRVLESINPKAPEAPQGKVISVAEQMEITGHVGWSPEHRGFRVNPGAAGIMTKFLKATRPGQYRDILKVGTEYYENLQEKGHYREHCALDHLYLKALLATETAETT